MVPDNPHNAVFDEVTGNIECKQAAKQKDRSVEFRIEFPQDIHSNETTDRKDSFAFVGSDILFAHLFLALAVFPFISLDKERQFPYVHTFLGIDCYFIAI